MLFTKEEFIIWKRAVLMILKWYEKKFAEQEEN